MRKVETYVLHTHNDSFARIFLRDARPVIDWQRIDHGYCGIHLYACALPCLNAHDVRAVRKTGESVQWYGDDVDVAYL